VRPNTWVLVALAAAFSALSVGCSVGPSPESAAPPPSGSSVGHLDEPALGRVLTGSADSVGAIPGSASALYYYRFRQTDPGSDRFTFQDRELSFYFRPTPDALHFQVENRTDRPVWIDWDRSTFLDPLGRSGRLAHSATRWRDRYGTQAATQIPGLQRYGDFLVPMDYLLDPAGEDRLVYRALLPEDENAPQFSGRDFGVDLTFRIDSQPRTYPFRFRVVSVIPNR
jgi:hypothetical protein